MRHGWQRRNGFGRHGLQHALMRKRLLRIRKRKRFRFDWFGAYVVGLATAIGGGTIRDVLLDVTPGWMTNPIYLICTGLALIWVICFGRWLIRLNNTFFIFDTIGLALFTVVGVGKSIALGYPFWVAIIMGSITGAAGGVIRDVFINEIPLIFRKEIYAMADRKSTRLNSSHTDISRMPSSA